MDYIGEHYILSHFAEIDENGLVIRVLVVPNQEENRGEDYLSKDLKLGGNWVKCSYNGTIRKNFPGNGFIYDSTRDAFIPPKPFELWVLNENTCLWESPISYPSDGCMYYWVDESGWVKTL